MKRRNTSYHTSLLLKVRAMVDNSLKDLPRIKATRRSFDAALAETRGLADERQAILEDVGPSISNRD